ncbi:hypothetical protein lbkm_2554 [Lachnospiraceae bacterium KM106-2]|nr:hypothetical protein lbkm_2554 [Lachnospiraceae bacterium KM106-2]
MFNKEEESSSVFGNIARCYQKKGMYNEAIQKLEESLNILKQEKSLNSRINIGYAYQWLAEIYLKKGETKKSKEYSELCISQWNKYAPGLLRLIS